MSVVKNKGPVFDPGVCRCCGSMKKCRVLNVEYESFGQKEIYSDMLMDCYGLLLSHLDGKLTDRLVCATCVQRIREAWNFRKQVLQCEEVFLQMKMFGDSDDDHSGQTLSTGAKIEVEVVKMEVDTVNEDTVDEDPVADNSENYNDVKAESDSGSSNDDVPILQRFGKSNREQSIVYESNVSQQNGMSSLCDSKQVRSKSANLPMSKVQQLMRERDASYRTETNILTIVEYSYVCPFKCRHNHLLCYYCGAHFSDPDLLRDHTAKEHHPKKFKIIEHKKMLKIDLTRIDCRLCITKINCLEEFKRHISNVHNKKYYHDCMDLVLPFKLTKDDLKCAVCESIFPYFHALNKHMNVHFSNYVCETCGLGFVDKGRFVMHQLRHEEGDFPCETCGKVFKAQYNRDLHIDRVHKKRGRVFCPKCDVKLMSYAQKLKHLVEIHGEQPLSFPCNLCDKVCDTRRTLTIHRRKDHLKDYRYECQYCGQKFFTRFALNNHMPTHTGERNFKCKVCEKSYPRLKTLKDHMRIHTNDRRYRCHICGQAFIQNCSLKGHMKSQHPEYG